VADWDTAPALWRHALTSRLAQDLSEHPLLVTEPVWNTSKNREKTIEVAFEDFDVPAFYLAKNAVCAGFAFGKSSALVLDVGAANIAATPVHDGYVLKKGSVRTPTGGDFLSNQIRTQLAAMGISVTPHYQVLSKVPVDVGKPAEATLKTWPEGQAPTESFRRFEEERVLTEFKECCAQAWPGPGPLPAAINEGGLPNVAALRAFEFPDGYNMVFGLERFRMTEGVFTPRSMLVSTEIPHPDPEHTLGLKELVFSAMKDVDIEIKPHILNNVVVTGAGSLLYQFNERAMNELSIAFPGPRVKLLATQNPVERRYATWLGASILASLGSFHQLWISKKEYEEHGQFFFCSGLSER
jgi:actin-related protein 4